MRKLLVLGVILTIYYIWEDMQESRIKSQQRYDEIMRDRPDSTKTPLRWDWELEEWIYEENSKRPVVAHYEIAPYVDVFYQYAREQGRTLPNQRVTLEFNSHIRTKDNAVGQCTKVGDLLIIYIDPRDWDDYPEHRESLVLHEMGHCILNRRHDNTLLVADSTLLPKSIMHENWHAYRIFYGYYKNYYIKELFNITN